MTDAYPLSPCIGICRMDDDRRHCTGCGRTLNEIAGWSTMPVDQRRQVMAELPGRMNGGRRPTHTDRSA
ncbi:putative Fe-S protein YdhL (DUF1289 family) [Natronocella acetinitrilica]|uniref:Fe-S protein YdhL (DUF1289 family) n=1 Tax=Natronocella acetinitrilica TaxID=414046 RepID=A0AAE3KB31_9GAMM|nr:DUF1289 domain-containing protein [Natronocella acetinitrilica]MCP1675080.1 putative Fe-S protein YdhL (DUF1289 family) [Natronocella acetinitrilica]